MPEQGLNVRNWLERFLNPSNHDLVVARAQYGAASNPDVLRAQARGQIASDFELAMSQRVASARARHIREAVEGVTDRDLWSVLNSAGFGEGDIRVFRAALLAALTGEK